jgi:hypothetical protein
MNEFETYIKDEFNDNEVNVFFKKIINNFSEESFSFYSEWGEFPFLGKEKQVNSVLIPAIHNYTKNIFLELPFKSKLGNQRFLDIVTTKDNNIFLIELKHSYQSKNDCTTKRTDREWETAINQIADLKKSVVKQHYNYKKYNVYKIALLIMPTFLPSNKKHDILKLSAKEYANKIFHEYEEGYKSKYQANMVGVIKIDKFNDYVHEYSDGNQVYPFISFVTRIERVE